MTTEEFAVAYREGRSRTSQFLHSCGAGSELSDELTQSAWVRGWERLSQLRDDTALIPWVNSIALNQFRRAYRKQQRYTTLPERSISRAERRSVATRLAAVELSHLMSQCEAADRALLKAQLAGVTAKDLSQREGITETAARLRFFRARSAARMVANTRPVHGRPSATNG